MLMLESVQYRIKGTYGTGLRYAGMPTPVASTSMPMPAMLKGQFNAISLYDVYRRDSGGSCLCGRPVVLGSLLLLWLFGLSVALIVVSVKYRKYHDGQFYVAKKEEGV